MSVVSGGERRTSASLAASEPASRAVAVGASAVVATLLGASVLAAGGTDSGPIAWLGIASLAIVAALSALAIAGVVPLPRLSHLAMTMLVALALLVIWTGLSLAWSLAPDLSWSYFNRGLTYLGLFCVGLFFPLFVRRAPAVFGALFAVAVAAAAVWALAGKIDPSLFEDGFRKSRLREPVGYWNTLALLFAYGAPLSLWLTIRRHHPGVRALGAGMLFVLIPAIMLTLSRSGILVALLAILAWLVLAPGRLETVAALLLAVPAGAALGIWAVDQPGLSEDGQSLAIRAADGRMLGWMLGIGFLAVVGVALALALVEARRPLTDEIRARALRVIVYAAGGLVVIGLIAFAVKVGNPVAWADDKLDEFQSSELVSNDPSRLTNVSSNNRLDWWREAAEAFKDEPVLGTGAGTFPIVHRLYRENEISVTSPHNVLMQFLAELGIVGALLAVTATLAGLLAARRATRRLPDDQQLAGLALTIVFAVFAVHALVDVDWEFLAVCAPPFLGLGVLLGGRRGLWLDGYRPLALLAPLILVPFVLAFLLPSLAARTSSSSAEQLFENPERARALARQAHALDPLALDPIFARANAEVVLGRTAAARAAYLQAVELQPGNPLTWLQLTEFEIAEGELDMARASWRRLSELDPYDCRVRELGVALELGGTRCG